MDPTGVLAASVIIGGLIGAGGILWAQRRVITGKLIPLGQHQAALTQAKADADARAKQWEDQVQAVRAELIRQAETHAATVRTIVESSERRITEIRELATVRVADRDEQLAVVRADRDARLSDVAADNAVLWDALRTTERAYETVTRTEIAQATAAVRVAADVLRSHGFANRVQELGPGVTRRDDDDATTG